MTAGHDCSSSWTKIGQSRTTPVNNTNRAEVMLDIFYLVVGFEVNYPKAFVNEVHDLSVDYGHAFFYFVKNTKIIKSFSFGPAGEGKTGWLGKGEQAGFGRNAYNTGAIKKDGYRNSRPGTPDFPIRELVKAFRISLSSEQAKKLEIMTEKARLEILNGDIPYTAMLNDTCGETAKEVLDSAGIITPSGSGLVKHSKILDFPIAYAVNPYKWHKDFRDKYKETSYPNHSGGFILATGDDDPIFSVLALCHTDMMSGASL